MYNYNALQPTSRIRSETNFFQEMELHEASFCGQTKRVQMLPQQKAPVNSVDKVYKHPKYEIQHETYVPSIAHLQQHTASHDKYCRHWTKVCAHSYMTYMYVSNLSSDNIFIAWQLQVLAITASHRPASCRHHCPFTFILSQYSH